MNDRAADAAALVFVLLLVVLAALGCGSSSTAVGSVADAGVDRLQQFDQAETLRDAAALEQPADLAPDGPPACPAMPTTSPGIDICGAKTDAGMATAVCFEETDAGIRNFVGCVWLGHLCVAACGP